MVFGKTIFHLLKGWTLNTASARRPREKLNFSDPRGWTPEPQGLGFMSKSRRPRFWVAVKEP